MLNCSRMSLSEVQKPKAPQTNWSEHVKVLDGSPSSVTKHLSSNFLYALESQKPGRCRDMAARYYVYICTSFLRQHSSPCVCSNCSVVVFYFCPIAFHHPLEILCANACFVFLLLVKVDSHTAKVPQIRLKAQYFHMMSLVRICY